MTTVSLQDGVRTLVPRDKMCESARKLRDTYARIPDIPLFRSEFGYFGLEGWKEQGMPQDVPLDELFVYDAPGSYDLWGLGWVEAAFEPAFEIKVIENRGKHEVCQDAAGRLVLYFTGQRSGFMPTYLDHPVKDMKTWIENVQWRLDPKTPGRCADLAARMEDARLEAARGLMIVQRVIGGYMYLRSLIGPEQVMYALYDAPDLIHSCMQTWLELADTIIARHQAYVTLDEFFFSEDICYKQGPLISPDMIREFLFPYYQELMNNIKSRQIDTSRHLYVHLDSDGFVNPIIPLYQEAIGVDVICPCEVAAGCDVLEIGRQHPDLVIWGGIDKRELAKGKLAIDALLERIIPVMRARGGYIPTCDHGVPEEVSYENYVHYRRRCVELGG